MFELIAFILANYAIARTVTKEHGPTAIFSEFRAWATKYKPQPPTEPTQNTDYAWAEYNRDFDKYESYIRFWRKSISGTFGDAVTCAYCLSYYSALLIVGYWVVSTGIYWYSPIAYFATVGGTHFLLKIEDK